MLVIGVSISDDDDDLDAAMLCTFWDEVHVEKEPASGLNSQSLRRSAVDGQRERNGHKNHRPVTCLGNLN